ncbi:hypothetical protein GGQ80_000764 [Sphingomonas jinjuensis]|uniref:Uncharacterized protein n=1 Tax=Sphingomonas jinjuensis TaxID=535907 RepID=A0A840F9A2_9SPHN|nr:hypothetical protein [Sphingomonas jinjuensis]MBB4152876.1 hypothetical protein [Sphingomonas jinjuensis]
MDEPLALAIIHLRRFRATFNAGELVDEESGLTADDFDRIFEALRVPLDPAAIATPAGDDAG